MRRKFLLGVLVGFACLSGFGQQMMLSEPLHMAGDTLRGVAFMGQEELSGYAYFLSLYDEEGEIAWNELIWVDSQHLCFNFPLAPDLKTGMYSLQLTNYQNFAVTHAMSVPIVDVNGHVDGLERALEPKETMPLPARNYLQIEEAERTSSQMVARISSLIDTREIASLAVTAYDLGQNPARSAGLADFSCNGAADHRVATRGLNQWLTAFHVEGWLMKGQEPLVGETITLSDPEKVRALRHTTTNETGKFGFYNVDHDGQKDIFISVLNSELQDYRLLLSDSRITALQRLTECPQSFGWDKAALTGWVKRRRVQKRVMEQYLPQAPPRRQLALPDPQPLFVDADQTILLDDYVPLASVREVIGEIVPYVHLSKKRLRVFAPERRQTFDGYPLLLVNGVPISNDSIALNLDVEQLHSVQVLNTTKRVASLGSIARSGVVSFVTRDPSFYPKGMDPYQIPGFLRMDEVDAPSKTEGVPHFPSVLYWEPNAKMTGAEHEIQFDVADYDTRVKIEVVARLVNGEIVTGEQVVEINKRPR